MVTCPLCGKISPNYYHRGDPKENVREKCYFCKANDRELVDKNTTGVSSHVAMVEGERRRKYEEIIQANTMYKAAKALGFPDKVLLDVKYQLPYYIIVSVHRCFDPQYYNYISTEYDNGSLCFFYRLKLEPSDTESIYDQISVAPGGEEIPKFVVWLLVCMKLFYEKDWDGRKWIDEKECFKYDESLSTYRETSQISDMWWGEVTKKMAEQMAKDIDNEIIKVVRKNPENWQVQIGNVVYGNPSKKYLGGLGV